MSDVAAALAAANGKAPDVDIKALLRSSRRAERSVPICLRGDLVAQFEELDRQLAEAATRSAAKPNDTRLANPAVAEGQRLAEAMLALQDQMRSSTVMFRLRALAPKRWQELTAEHPPRKGDDGKVHEEDQTGVNMATFFEPLLRESVVDPVLDDDDWVLLYGRDEPDPNDPDAGHHGLSDAQFDLLSGAAWSLNRRVVDVPFSSAASRILRNSEPA